MVIKYWRVVLVALLVLFMCRMDKPVVGIVTHVAIERSSQHGGGTWIKFSVRQASGRETTFGFLGGPCDLYFGEGDTVSVSLNPGDFFFPVKCTVLERGLK